MGGWDAGDSAGNQRSGARARDEVAPGSREGRCGERSEVSSGMRARDLLRDCVGSAGGGTWRVAPAEPPRGGRASAPRHFKSFVVATGVVLVGVGLVRTNAGERKRARSKLVRHALGFRRGERAGPRIRVEERRDVLYFTNLY